MSIERMMENQNPKPHPNLTLYKRTAEMGFPLILVVGREPNDDAPVSADFGEYDFDKSPNCGLWNMAYRLLAMAKEDPRFGTRELKSACRACEASPIIISDALPITLKDQVHPKTKAQRRQLSIELTNCHVADVFRHNQIIERVRLVFLAGHRGMAQFENASRAYKRELGTRGIPFVETRFFSPYNSKKIVEEVQLSTAWHALQMVLDEFENTILRD